MNLAHILTLAALTIGFLSVDSAEAGGKHFKRHHGSSCENCNSGGHHGHGLWNRGQTVESWHGNYYDMEYGMPVSLVVPPTVKRQGHYSWGAPSSSTSYINSQFGTAYPGDSFGDGGYGGMYPTPHWPSHTDQFGIYYVRGPWR